jgi:hypothetical protein
MLVLGLGLGVIKGLTSRPYPPHPPSSKGEVGSLAPTRFPYVLLSKKEGHFYLLPPSPSVQFLGHYLLFLSSGQASSPSVMPSGFCNGSFTETPVFPPHATNRPLSPIHHDCYLSRAHHQFGYSFLLHLYSSPLTHHRPPPAANYGRPDVHALFQLWLSLTEVSLQFFP